MMKFAGLATGAVALSLFGTAGCATHKYVVKTIAPVEQRVGATEAKDADQDKQLAAQGTQVQDLDRGLSRTNEKLNDTDAKATKAGQAAQAADQKAGAAQQSANGAQQAADAAHSFAEQGINHVEAMNKFQMTKSEAVLFPFNSAVLTTDGKAQLDELSKEVAGKERFVIEVQGFTDKSGTPGYNESLSQQRAMAVSRYLANNYEIPVRSISILGSGYARPVADDKTRDGRKMNRRVEVRVFVPEDQAGKAVASNAAGQ